MKTFNFFLLFLLFSLNSLAQQVKRIELPPNNFGNSYYPIPIASKGILVLAQTSKSTYGLIMYDKDLEQLWTSNGNIDEKLDYATSYYDGKSVYLLFSKFESNVYQVVKVYLGPGITQSFDIYSIDKIQVSDFKANNDVIYIAGTARSQPIILRTDLINQNTRVLPTALKSEAELQSIEIDSLSGGLIASFVLKKGKNYDILLKSFDSSGKQETQVIVEPENELALINGKLTGLNDSTKYLIGTYGFRNQQSTANNISQGIYVNKIADAEVGESKYYSFADLSNFFNFMKDKDRERLERKIEKKKEKGDEYKLNYRLLVHDIIQKKDKFLVVAEAFYPDYKYVNNNGLSPFNNGFGPYGFSNMYNPYGWGWGRYSLNQFNYNGWGYRNSMMNNNSGKILDGYVYTHAIVAEFDSKGTLIWDNSIEFKDLKSMKLKERVKATLEGDNVTLSYILDGKIFKKTFKDKTKNEQVNEINVVSDAAGDKVRKSENEELEYWYDKYAVAWGSQKLQGQQGRREVFYINKIEF